MIPSANENSSRRGLLLEVALQAKRCVALQQHFLVHRTVDSVAGGAAFANGFVLEHKRSMLRGVALGAIVTLRSHGCERGRRVSFVRVMAIGAGHFAFDDRMAMRQIEFPTLVEMALKTYIRRFTGIDNGVVFAAGLIMDAARSMARFTTHLSSGSDWSHQPRMRRRGKIFCNILVTFLAGF